MSDKFVYNNQPSLHNIYSTVPEGTALSYSEIPVNDKKWPGVPDEWYAVSGKLATIRRPDRFTVLEYGEEWCKAEYKGVTGYVKNNFETKLKLPDDPTKTPYESRSNYTITLYATPEDIVNPDANADGWLYAKKETLDVGEEGIAVTNQETELYTYPSTYGFLFGTNDRGQDLWSRVWSGTRTSLYIGFMVAIVEAFVGIMVGILWGYVRKLDRILTELYNVLDNIPTTIVLILIAYVMSPSVNTIIFAMCLTRWMGMARFIRNQIIIIRDRDYNVASRCLGVSSGQIMLKNLLPYLVSVIMLRMALAIPGAIGNEVFITYIGLGIPVNTPSLGNLINEGRALFVTAPSLRYQLLFPTIVLSIITISFYIIGNTFADAADPRNHL
ncbi:MAG: ABC transporter permease subunit [Clostridia bacterium]|nr:ABC transporter permease subunit [Clostridia bacterium]